MDDHAAVPGPLGVVALVPAAGESLEVGLPVLVAFGVIPETQGHGREWERAGQLAALSHAQGLSLVVEHLYGHAEGGTLDLPGVDR